MAKIVAADERFERMIVPRAKALEMCRELGQKLKDGLFDVFRLERLGGHSSGREDSSQDALPIVKLQVRQGGAFDLEGLGGLRVGPVLADIALEIHFLAGKNLSDCLAIVGRVEADQESCQPPIAERFMQPDRVGHQLKALNTPGRPKVDQNHFASIGSENFRETLLIHDFQSRPLGWSISRC